MKPGRELDALVAEKVMGYVIGNDPHFEGAGPKIVSGPHWITEDGTEPTWQRENEWPITCLFYSTDIAAAWEVVEKLCNWDADDNMLTLKGQAGDPKNADDPGHWWKAEISGTSGKFMGEADTVPEAICLAALKAKGVE